jgi:formylglycine-generating enzyme required for sulfatase activity
MLLGAASLLGLELLVMGIQRMVPQPGRGAAATGQPRKPGERATNPKDGAELVWVPPGSFRMGSDDGDTDEKPVHEVRITQGYWLYRTEVTHEQYDRFLKANSGYPKPSLWTDNRFKALWQPVVGVSWNDAVKYGEWAGVCKHRCEVTPLKGGFDVQRTGNPTVFLGG